MRKRNSLRGCLLTRTSSKGWIPLFPSAAAVVTEPGGYVSHAGIIAMEVCIPANLGWDDATLRMKYGDPIRDVGQYGIIGFPGRV